MPGVIMDHGSRNGSHTNHDRDERHNGVNGIIYTSEKTQDKGKGRVEPQQNMTPISPTMPNGINGTFSDDPQHANGAGNGHDMQNRVDQLPPEILHITQGYMPLSGLLSRLAQHSNTALQATLTELAQMPLPASMTNGNTSHSSSTDDNSPENQAKKKRLLDFATNTHESWTKALVVTGWSRKADEVSRAVDIKVHVDQEKAFYTACIDELAFRRRSFSTDPKKRWPNPDLKTAVPVLTTGKAHWMPDLGYISQPPLTSKDVLQSLEKLNTLLSARLNLDDYDSIPLQFKDFTIKSGRATFKVEGEFELDVTIADEEPQSQFWFIDFRFLFWPSASILTPRARTFIESRVNEILLRDGLSGCYKFLHEMILTYKISEFRHQAIDLGRAKWVETLKVEALNRALSVQYWLDRYNGSGTKSWIILGVHSGKREDGRPDANSTSRLSLRWFRDHKEVKDADISFDTVNISTESLLRVVIAMHISHILTVIFDKLSAHTLYANRELGISLVTSPDDPSKPELEVSLTNERRLSLKIDPISGRFVFSPTMLMAHKYEVMMNAPSRDPKDSTGKRMEDTIDKALRVLENLRYSFITDDIVTRGVSLGWRRLPDPGIKRSVLFESIPKNTQMSLWLRRPGWAEDWYLLVCLSMSGANWFLIKLMRQATPLDPNPNALGIGPFLKVQIKTVSPTINYMFLTALNIYTGGLLSYYANLKTLHAKRVRQMLRQGPPSRSLTLPVIFVKISELLRDSPTMMNSKAFWAKKDVIKLTYKGVEVHAPSPNDINALSQTSITATQSSNATLIRRPTIMEEKAVLVTEARMIVPLPKNLAILNEKVDPDIAFHPTTGSFALRLYSKIGESVIPELIERITGIGRLVQFVDVLQKHEKTLKCESVSLGKIVFKYGQASSTQSDPSPATRPSLQYSATVDFSTGENTMTLILEKANPHLRIKNFLTNVLNSAEGLNGVATLLTLTLPLLRGLTAIEEAWNDSALYEKGEAFVTARATDWYNIRYNLRQPAAQNQTTPPRLRRVLFDLRLRQRRGEPWWHLHRTDNLRLKDWDNLDTALKPLWTTSGPGWRAMMSSAAGQGNGIEELLAKMDDVVRTFAMSDVGIQSQQAADVPAPIPKQAPTQAPPSRQPQQQRQQPTPSQSQSQSQDRGNPRHKVIEID
ncbi:MED14-domain-containing protein [Mollisia scopiformis]|uniref:Mediator of RNA polymerase II transcription subunit 14 n=1 Tax=Mollisia scopiformis TaxID=149040 RepID=A0A194XV72_MOLSC|nr:MED14-domain-containing protein [Mollisia scopiformis]KUJ24036.1 MED14-domain-containing protein [Mollisia scopiformis]